MNNQRVVITGLGVVAPNAVGLTAFEEALKGGKSGIRFLPELQSLNFSCQIGGVPPLTEEIKQAYIPPLMLKSLKSSGVIYGIIAGKSAWEDADLHVAPAEEPDWESGCLFGSGMTGVEALRYGVNMIDEGKVKRLGSQLIKQAMSSSVSAHLGGLLGLGNWVSTNSSACSTGSEAILLAYERLKLGKASRILAGGCDSQGKYVWGGFDSMRVLTRKMNDQPTQASRPMSASAAGFVPGAGAGAMVLETLESAQKRGVRIYAEILGGAVNAGGQRGGGTMTAPNPKGIQKCIQMAILNAGIRPQDIQAISGHLTATKGDPLEVSSWVKALELGRSEFPYIHSLKSMIGHCLSAAGAIESVAVVNQLYHSYLHPSINCEDLHPEIDQLIANEKIPRQSIQADHLKIMAKSSFGFGDVNTVIIFKKWEEED